MENIHSLLKRQIKKHLDEKPLSDKLKAFMDAVNSAYFDFDADRNMNERSFEFSSQELLQTNADLRNMQKQLLQSEKMATVGQLAAGVAHEINNPSSFVINNLEVLAQYIIDLKLIIEKYTALESHLRQTDTGDFSSFLNDIEKIKKEYNLEMILEDLPKLSKETLDGMERIKKIVTDLKTFSHSDEGKITNADIHELIDLAINIAMNEIKYKAAITKEYTPNISSIQCFPQQLSQVFLNLIVNAAQAIDDKGEIKIKTSEHNDTVVIEISDTGSGMSEDTSKHVFEPFFTTKPVGKGTGLGLSMAYNIIEKHHGKISVVSHSKEGTCFTIHLPKQLNPS